MSMAYFMEGDQPAVWRGPMVSNAFDKMAFGTDWGALDVLVVDMPPGMCRAICSKCSLLSSCCESLVSAVLSLPLLWWSGFYMLSFSFLCKLCIHSSTSSSSISFVSHLPPLDVGALGCTEH